MDYKTFCEDAEIEISFSVRVNGVLVLQKASQLLETVEEEIGRIERHDLIQKELQKQFEELPENIDD